MDPESDELTRLVREAAKLGYGESPGKQGIWPSAMRNGRR